MTNNSLMRVLTTTALVFSPAVFSACSHKPTLQQAAGPQFVRKAPFFGQSKIQEYKLPNGLQILLLEDHVAPLVTYMTWVRAGSRDELSGKTGLAHLFEHMMFRETMHLKNGEFAMKVAEMGGGSHLNANTYTDRTTFFTSLPSMYLEEITRLEADRLENLKITQELLNNERGAVLGELNMGKDRPGRRLSDELFKTAFTKSPYRITTIGLKEDIERFTVEDCLTFYKMYYAPNNATILIIGDFDPSNAVDLVNKYYGQIQSKTSPPRDYAKEPEQTSPREKSVKLPIGSEHFALAFHTPGIEDPDQAALTGLAAVLSSGQSSPLYRSLVDKQIVKSIDASVYQFNLPSLFVVSGEMNEGKKSTQALQVIKAEIERIKKGDFTDDDLARAKKQYKLDAIDYLKKGIPRGHFIGEALTSADGNYLRNLEILNGLERVTKSDVQRMAKKYLIDEHRTLIRLLPEVKK